MNRKRSIGRLTVQVTVAMIVLTSLLAVPVAAQQGNNNSSGNNNNTADQHVVCDISFAKSFLNRVVQIIGGGYATLTLLAILGEKAISSIPLIPQDTRQTLIEWRRRIILGAVVIYAGVPMLYQVLLDAGAPFPACLEILPI